MAGRISNYSLLGFTTTPFEPFVGNRWTGIDGTFAAGQVVTNDQLPLQLSCVAAENGAPVRSEGGLLYLYFATGSIVKPDLRLYYVDRSYTVPAKGSAFRIPAGSPDAILGWRDIAAADWIGPLDDDGTVTNGWAFVTIPSGKTLVPRSGMSGNGGTRSVYVVPVALGSFTLAASAYLGLTETFERH